MTWTDSVVLIHQVYLFKINFKNLPTDMIQSKHLVL